MFDLLLQADAMPHRHLRQGHSVYKENQECDGNIFIVMDGEVTEYVGTGPKMATVREYTAGMYFGDIEVISGSPIRLRTLKVTTGSAALAIMNQHNMRVLGGLYPEFFLSLLRSSIDQLNGAERALIDRSKKSL